MVTGLGLDASPVEAASPCRPGTCARAAGAASESMRVAGALELLLQPCARAPDPCCRRPAGCARRRRRGRARAAVLLADRDEGEVGGAAADVAHQDQVADLHALAPVVALRGRATRRTPPAALRAGARPASRPPPPPGASARGPPRRTTRARSPAPPGRRALRRRRRARAATREPGAPGTAPTRTRATRGERRPGACHGRMSAVRSTPACESHDFADATRRAGFSAPRLRASSPITASASPSQGNAIAPAAKSA